MFLLYCWNSAPITFSTILEEFLKLSCRYTWGISLSPHTTCCWCGSLSDVSFNFQGHPMVETQAPSKQVPWNPVHLNQIEERSSGDPTCAWGSCWCLCLDALNDCYSLSSWQGVQGTWWQALARLFCLSMWLWTNILATKYLSTGVKHWCERNIFI